MQRTMSADVKSLPKNNSSLAFPFWLNKMKKAPTQEGGLARVLMQKKTARNVIMADQSTNNDNSPEKINMAESVKADTTSSSPTTKKACICAPTNHAGSFRCQFHRAKRTTGGGERSFGSKTSTSTVRTNGDGQPRLSRFAGAACGNLPLTMASSSKPEKVK